MSLRKVKQAFLSLLLWFRIQNMTCFYDSFQIVFYILGFSYFVELESSKTELMVFYNLMTEMLPHHFHIQREGKGKTCNC